MPFIALLSIYYLLWFPTYFVSVVFALISFPFPFCFVTNSFKSRRWKGFFWIWVIWNLWAEKVYISSHTHSDIQNISTYIQRYGINVELLRFRFDHLKANKNISCCLKNLLNVNRCDIFSELVKFVTKPSVWFYSLLISKDEVLIWK